MSSKTLRGSKGTKIARAAFRSITHDSTQDARLGTRLMIQPLRPRYSSRGCPRWFDLVGSASLRETATLCSAGVALGFRLRIPA